MRFLLLLAALFLPTIASARSIAPDPAVIHANAVRSGGAAYREGYFGSGNARLHYVEAGKGPLIILYHGFPSFWFSWFDQMEILKTRHRVVAVDAPGAGLSAKPAAGPQTGAQQVPDAYRIANLARGLDRLARHLNGGRRFVLIGHDWGAALAFAYAQAYPGRLRAVIGMSAPSYNLFLDLVARDAEQQKRSQYMQAFKTIRLADIGPRGLTDRLFAGYAALIEKGSLTPAEGQLFKAALADPRAINGGMNWYRANIPAFDRISAADRWPSDDRIIDVPALLIWGDADQTFVPSFIDRMHTYARDLTVVRIPGVGHWTPIEQPRPVTAAVEALLRRVDAPVKEKRAARSSDAPK